MLEIYRYIVSMNFCVQAIVCLFALGFFPIHGFAVTQDNPYHTILDRNPFGLNPPELPQTNKIVEPPKNVKFNGITQIRGRTKAFFTIPGKDPKDPPQYVTLSEAERTDDLEVTKIFRDEGEVEVVNSGIKMVLSFKNNGNKNTPPPISPLPIAQTVAPAMSSVVYNPTAAHSVNGSSPASIQQSSFGGTPQPASALSPVSSGAVYTPALSSSSSVPTSLSQIDPVQQRMNMLAQHAAATADYESGRTRTVFKPQTDPKVFAPGGMVPHEIRIPPPPPMPPAPPSR